MQGNPQSSWLRTHMHARSKDEMRQQVAEFESKFGMPQAFGCIDGTHIPLKRPSENSHQEGQIPGFASHLLQEVLQCQII